VDGERAYDARPLASVGALHGVESEPDDASYYRLEERRMWLTFDWRT